MKSSTSFKTLFGATPKTKNNESTGISSVGANHLTTAQGKTPTASLLDLTRLDYDDKSKNKDIRSFFSPVTRVPNKNFVPVDMYAPRSAENMKKLKALQDSKTKSRLNAIKKSQNRQKRKLEAIRFEIDKKSLELVGDFKKKRTSYTSNEKLELLNKAIQLRKQNKTWHEIELILQSISVYKNVTYTMLIKWYKKSIQNPPETRLKRGPKVNIDFETS
jgi:galactokinase